MTENEILERWNSLGLMDGIEDNKKLKLSLLYEDAVDILSNTNERTKTSYSFTKLGIFETISFPIIYRVVKSIDAEKTISISDIFDIIQDNYDKIRNIAAISEGFSAIDTEMEITEFISNLVIENIARYS